MSEKFYFFGNQKKALAAAYVVGLIIILVSVAVLILVFSSMYDPNTAQRTACKTSAVVRATLPDISTTNIKEAVFLNCKTRRICVTSKLIGDEGCSEVFGKDYEKMRVTGSVEQMSDQIKMIVAREMAECWNTFGEGNLQIFKQEVRVADSVTKAVVCSRFYFDSSVTSKIPDKTVVGLNDYMLTHKAPGQNKSYWDYLRNTPDGETIGLLYASAADINDSLDLTQQKSIIYLETGKSKIGEYIGAGAGFILGNFAFGKGIGVVGKVASSIGGPWAKTAVYGAIEGTFLRVGGNYGEWVQDMFSPMGSAQTVSAIILIDYTVEALKDKAESFQNIP